MEKGKQKLLWLRIIALIVCCFAFCSFLASFMQKSDSYYDVTWERAQLVTAEGNEDISLPLVSPEPGLTYLLSTTLDNPERWCELHFSHQNDEITISVDDEIIYSYAAKEEGSAVVEVELILPNESAGKTLTIRYRTMMESNLYFPYITIMTSEQLTAQDYGRANSSGIPAGFYSLASLILVVMLLLGRHFDWRLIPLTLAFVLLAVSGLTDGQGELFLPEAFVEFFCNRIVLHLPCVLLIVHLVLNRRRTDKRVFFGITAISAAALVAAYFISLAIGGGFAFMIDLELLTFSYNYPLNFVFLLTYWLLFVCLASAVYSMIYENITAEAERRALSIREAAAREAYKALEDNARRGSEFRHEIKNHLLAMSAMSHKGEAKKLSDYIDKLSGETELIHTSAFSEHFLINSILQQYSSKSAKAGVRFEAIAAVPPELGISDEDLCAFLMNLLENAIYAASRQLPEDKPKIQLNGSFLSINCKTPARIRRLRILTAITSRQNPTPPRTASASSKCAA